MLLFHNNCVLLHSKIIKDIEFINEYLFYLCIIYFSTIVIKPLSYTLQNYDPKLDSSFSYKSQPFHYFSRKKSVSIFNSDCEVRSKISLDIRLFEKLYALISLKSLHENIDFSSCYYLLTKFTMPSYFLAELNHVDKLCFSELFENQSVYQLELTLAALIDLKKSNLSEFSIISNVLTVKKQDKYDKFNWCCNIISSFIFLFFSEYFFNRILN